MDKKEIILHTILTEILPQYQQAVTLRQLYYRVLSKFAGTDYFPNKGSSYQFLSKLIVQARLDGRIPYDTIEDRTREI